MEVDLRCRVCGKTMKADDRKTHKLKSEMSKWINRAYQIDVSCDDERIPKYVCESCRPQLSKNYRCMQTRKKFNLTIKLYDWTDELNKSKCPSTVDAQCDERDEAFMTSAEDIATKHGFQKWKQPSGEVYFIRFNPATLCVDRCLTLDGKRWRITVQGKHQVPSLHPSLVNIPDKISDSHLDPLFTTAVGPLCVGSPDYSQQITQKDVWLGNDGTVKAQRECEGPYVYKGITYQSTIRATGCSRLAAVNGQCPVCKIYRADLSASTSSISHCDRTSASSHVKMSHLTTAELTERAKNIQSERRALKKEVSILKSELDYLVHSEGVELKGDEMNTIVNECATRLDELLPEGSPQRLLWESQKKAISCKDLRGVRWHPAIIRWCVALHNKSPAAYRAMRDSNFIKLPHQNTIRQYIHYTDLNAGFDEAFVERIVDDFDLDNQPAHARRVSLMFDEMVLKSGLAYDANSGQIYGFTDLGSFNEEIQEFERRCRNIDRPPVATHVLVLMVRGITSKLQMPLAYFPCQGGCSANQIYNIVNEAVELLEFAAFDVDNLTSDGASPNRKFYSMMKVGDESTIDGVTFATSHIIRPEDRLFFTSDVPHLIKTARNCWENSRPGGTRNMMYKGLPIQWTHLREVYHHDLGLDSTNTGLRKLHKLHHEHVNLTPSLRMRVYMATQVLSNTVANAMESKPEYASTVTFIRMMNKFFDCLNVSNYSSSKPNSKPYRSPDDPRFQWLTDTFINFLGEWQDEGKTMDNLTADEKRRLCLSPQTLEGLRISDVANDSEIEFVSPDDKGYYNQHNIKERWPSREEMMDKKTYYRMTSKKKGRALVINNSNFRDKAPWREGSEIDKFNVTHFLRELGYDVEERDDLSASEIKLALKNFSSTCKQDCCSSVVVLMSYGNSKTIYGSDMKHVRLSKLLKNINGMQKLKTKPKLVFYLADQLPSTSKHFKEDVESMSNIVGEVGAEDVFVGYMSTSGHMPLRKDQPGSAFIQALCEVGFANAHIDTLEEMCNKVTQHIRNMRAGLTGADGDVVQLTLPEWVPQFMTKKLSFLPGFDLMDMFSSAVE